MKPKVYLAKSNLCDPTVVMRVRTYLQQFDIEIVEFSGGEYTNGPLLKCDHLFVIPATPIKFDYTHANTASRVKDKHIIGKGLHEQIKVFSVKEENDEEEEDHIYIFKGFEGDIPKFGGFYGSQPKMNALDWKTYATLTVGMSWIDLEDELGFKLSIVTQTKTISNRYLLLLAK